MIQVPQSNNKMQKLKCTSIMKLIQNHRKKKKKQKTFCPGPAFSSLCLPKRGIGERLGARFQQNFYAGSRLKTLKTLLTLTWEWCALLFALYSAEFLYLSEDSSSHQSFPSAPLEAARFTEKHEGLLRHLKVQSKMSHAATVSTLGTFRWWNSSVTKTCCLIVCIGVG